MIWNETRIIAASVFGVMSPNPTVLITVITK